MAAMTLPMVPPSFGYGRSDRRTPRESSVLRTARRLRPTQTATRDQAVAKCTDMPHPARLHSATKPPRAHSVKISDHVVESPGPMTGRLSDRQVSFGSSIAVHMYRARNGQAVFVWRAP